MAAAAALLAMVFCSKHPVVDNPPAAPSAPVGPDSGACDSLYLFTTSAVDPDSDSVAYRFDWGDGDTSGWTDFVASGECAGAEHAWYFASRCSVKAQAKDAQGALSDWSQACTMALRLGPRFADSLLARIPVGKEPVGLAALPSGEFIYVACRSSDAVSVIRTSDNKVVAAIPTGRGPWGVAATPDGRFVYVTNYDDTTVSVIRTSDNTLIDTVQVGDGPTELTILPNGQYVYVSRTDCDSVAVIRVDGNELVANVETGEEPGGIAALPGSRYVAVACCSDEEVWFINTDDNTLTARVQVGAYPWGVAVAPGGELVYVTVVYDYVWDEAGVHTITVPDFEAADSVVRLGPDWYPLGMASSPGGDYLYALDDYDDVPQMAVIATSTRHLVGFVSDPEVDELGPYGVTCLPNGLVYVADVYDDQVSVFGFSSGLGRNLCFKPLGQGR
jgi:YVTN family beta-propeller protein